MGRIADMDGSMATRRRLFILECTPKHEYREGEVLFNFLNMTEPNALFIRDFTNKSKLLSYIRRKRNLAGFDLIHLSGHGVSKFVFELPRGFVSPDEFPDSCFEGMIVTISACGLSSKEFMNPFIERTKARGAIAPQNNVEFADAAIFYSYFYYLVMHHRFSPARALDTAKRLLCDMSGEGRVRGGWFYWIPD